MKKTIKKIPKNCRFYTIQEIKGFDKPTEGLFDLRENIDALLGYCKFKKKKVLELGPASGFITFYLETKGAKVTCVDLSIKKDKWDTVPHQKKDWKKIQKKGMKDLSKVRNAFWFAHKQNQSKAKLIETHVKNLKKLKNPHDIGLVSQVLLHLQNPFLALHNMSLNVKEKMIISDQIDDMGKISTKNKIKISNIKKSIKNNFFKSNSFLKFLPRGDEKNLNYDTWWKLSPLTIVYMMRILGFEKEKYLEHIQYCNNKPVEMYTIVFRRKIKLK